MIAGGPAFQGRAEAQLESQSPWPALGTVPVDSACSACPSFHLHYMFNLIWGREVAIFFCGVTTDSLFPACSWMLCWH